MSSYTNRQGSTVVVQRDGSALHVTVSRAVDDPSISESSWSAQIAAAARRELGTAVRRVSGGGGVNTDSNGTRRERRTGVYATDSAPLHRREPDQPIEPGQPPRCDLAEHFGKGVAASARITVHGSMFPYTTTVHTCADHTPTPADIVAHNAAHGETVQSIEISELESGDILETWTTDATDAQCREARNLRSQGLKPDVHRPF